MTKLKKYKIAFGIVFFCLVILFVFLSCLPVFISDKYAIILNFPLWLCLLLLFILSGLWIAFGILAVMKHKKTGYAIIAITAVLFILCICIAPSLKSGITIAQDAVTITCLIILQILCLYYSLFLFCFERKIYGIVLLVLLFVIGFVCLYLSFNLNFINENEYLLYKTDNEVNLLFKYYKSLQNSNLSVIYQQRSLFVYEVIKVLPNNNVSANVAWIDKNIEYFDGGFFLHFENFIEQINYLN